MEEEEEGATAEKHIANTARQVSQDLHKYVVDKGEANWSTLHHPVQDMHRYIVLGKTTGCPLNVVEPQWCF